MEINIPEIIRLSGLKTTKQREAILRMFLESDTLLTAENVYLKLHSNGLSYGLATVYRTISTLCEHSLLQSVGIPFDNCQYFVFSHCEHIHHLICTKCLKCVPIDECPVEKFSSAMADENGFQMTGHSFQIFGICSSCIKAEK